MAERKEDFSRDCRGGGYCCRVGRKGEEENDPQVST